MFALARTPGPDAARAPKSAPRPPNKAGQAPANPAWLRLALSAPPSPSQSGGTIHRMCSECAKEDEEKNIHRRADASGDDLEHRASALFSGAVRSADVPAPDTVFRDATRGPGEQVPYRAEMEAAFGQPFRDVRAHFGKSHEMKLLGAEAATRGAHMAFRDSHPSRETVAHELVHVVQERSHGAGTPTPSRLSHPGDATEREATRLAPRAAAGHAVAVSPSAPAGISRETAASPQPASPAGTPQVPPAIQAEVDAMMERPDARPDEATLRRLGQLAVQTMAPGGVVAAAQHAGVPGAERREKELESAGGTIHRQAAEAAAATAAGTWWLTMVDGPLPIGDIVFGALVLAAAIAASQGIGKGDCYSDRSCSGKILGKKVKHCHNCKNYFSGKSVLHPSGVCEKC